jgi:hypothetical protein
LLYSFHLEFDADLCCKPGHYLGVRLGIQWGVFEALGDVGEPGKTIAQLAGSAGADQRLVGKSHIQSVRDYTLVFLRSAPPRVSQQGITLTGLARFMRHLAANGTVRETDLDTYASTRLSASFRQQSFKDAIYFM